MEKKVYFLADVHLGLAVGDPAEREQRFVAFLETLNSQNTAALFLLGDIFDFWYEYKEVVPKGFVRTLGALARLTDQGVPVHFFEGNHDMWTYGYLEREVGLTVHRRECYVTLAGKHFLLAHGDAQGRQEAGFRLLQYVFHAKIMRAFFGALHPRWGMALAHRWSSHNRLARGVTYTFRGEQEPVYQYVESYPEPIDYCIIGHLHAPACCTTPRGTQLMVLGSWVDANPVLITSTFRTDVGVLGRAEERIVEVVEPPVMVHLDHLLK